MSRKPSTTIEPLAFSRPGEGPVFYVDPLKHLPTTGQTAWRGNGGPTKSHPARSLPFSLEAPIDVEGVLLRVHVLGVLATYAGAEQEEGGTIGARVSLAHGDRVTLCLDLRNGRHYSDARHLEPVGRLLGDGSSIETVGVVDIDGTPHRVDLLTIDVPVGTIADTFRVRVQGGASSFVVFDVFTEVETPKSCPFHSLGGGIPLSEIGPIVRVGDRVRFSRALDQLEASLVEATDLDEARGQALTFLAVTTAAMLENGGRRELHREQLAAARELEGMTSSRLIAAAARRRIESVAPSLCREPANPSLALVDRALSVVERNFAKDLTDATVAQQLGLSTSHFRHLFRQATGQPFHKYLVALRLEKARKMLVEEEASVSSVARAVGFAGLAHFSRAFTQRFQVSPTTVRRSVD